MTAANARRSLVGALACALLLLAGWSGAQRLTLVPAANGGEALVGALERAVAAWEEAYGEPIGVTVAPLGADPAAIEGAAARVERGDPALLGPDVASLTLLEPGGATEVRLAPASLDAVQPLLHEIGLLLGVERSESGVMAAEIAADPAEQPTEPDVAAVAALRAALRFPDEDLTRDGVVDFYDLLELAEAFGTRGFLPADLNDDGVVDDEDLARLRAAYTFTAPAPEPPAGEAPADAGEGEPADAPGDEPPGGEGAEDEAPDGGTPSDGADDGAGGAPEGGGETDEATPDDGAPDEDAPDEDAPDEDAPGDGASDEDAPDGGASGDEPGDAAPEDGPDGDAE